MSDLILCLRSTFSCFISFSWCVNTGLGVTAVKTEIGDAERSLLCWAADCYFLIWSYYSSRSSLYSEISFCMAVTWIKKLFFISSIYWAKDCFNYWLISLFYRLCMLTCWFIYFSSLSFLFSLCLAFSNYLTKIMGLEGIIKLLEAVRLLTVYGDVSLLF